MTNLSFNDVENKVSINYADLFDGTKVSPCLLPCMSTKVSSAFISAQDVENFTVFDLTFSQVVTRTTFNFPLFQWTDYFSGLGGLMGLWLGLGVSQLLSMVITSTIKVMG